MRQQKIKGKTPIKFEKLVSIFFEKLKITVGIIMLGEAKKIATATGIFVGLCGTMI
jgi:hypothetical protein